MDNNNDEVYAKDGIYWSAGLPEKLHNLLNGRYGENQKQKNSPVTMLAYDEHSFVVFYSNGSYRYIGNNPDFEEALEDSKGDLNILALSFRTNSSGYLLIRGEYIYCRNLPHKIEQLIVPKIEAGIDWVALGNKHDSYFILYYGGRYKYNGLPDKLANTLRNCKKPIKRLYLSQFDDRYLLLYKDGSSEYQFSITQSLPTSVIKCKR